MTLKVSIVDEVKRAKFYSVIADETTDVSNKVYLDEYPLQSHISIHFGLFFMYNREQCLSERTEHRQFVL